MDEPLLNPVDNYLELVTTSSRFIGGKELEIQRLLQEPLTISSLKSLQTEVAEMCIQIDSIPHPVRDEEMYYYQLLIERIINRLQVSKEIIRRSSYRLASDREGAKMLDDIHQRINTTINSYHRRLSRTNRVTCCQVI